MNFVGSLGRATGIACVLFVAAGPGHLAVSGQETPASSSLAGCANRIGNLACMSLLNASALNASTAAQLQERCSMVPEAIAVGAAAFIDGANASHYCSLSCKACSSASTRSRILALRAELRLLESQLGTHAQERERNKQRTGTEPSDRGGKSTTEPGQEKSRNEPREEGEAHACDGKGTRRTQVGDHITVVGCPCEACTERTELDFHKTLVYLMLFGIIWEVSLAKLGEKCEEIGHRLPMEALEKVHEELSLVGSLSLAIFIVEKATLDFETNFKICKEWKETIELVHVFLFCVALVFVAMAMVDHWIFGIIKREWDVAHAIAEKHAAVELRDSQYVKRVRSQSRTSPLDSDALVYTTTKAESLRLVLPGLGLRGDSQSRRHRFLSCKALFCRENNLPQDFDFALYLRKGLSHAILDSMHISAISWSIGVAQSLLTYWYVSNMRDTLEEEARHRSLPKDTAFFVDQMMMGEEEDAGASVWNATLTAMHESSPGGKWVANATCIIGSPSDYMIYTCKETCEHLSTYVRFEQELMPVVQTADGYWKYEILDPRVLLFYLAVIGQIVILFHLNTKLNAVVLRNCEYNSSDGGIKDTKDDILSRKWAERLRRLHDAVRVRLRLPSSGN